ncbi:MAG: hypothetical protein CMI36_16705 [Owenweeksia sp.]|nr:hypothetical protein [Owenweeksia sp.]
MRKLLFSMTLLLATSMSLLFGQTNVVVGDTAGLDTYSYGPIYRSSASSSFNYCTYGYIFASSEIGLPVGTTINKIAWKKQTASTLTGGLCDLTIRMKESARSTWGSTERYDTLTSSSYTVVYSSTTQDITGAANTWVEFTLSTPIVYNGGTLEVTVDFNRDGATSDGAIDWYYETATGKGVGRAASTAPTASATTSSTYSGRRPATRFNVTYPAGACLPPTSLSATVLNYQSAQIDWVTGGASNWNIEYGVSGFTLGTGTMMNASSNSVSLNSLSGNTTYDVYVRDSCGPGDVSPWASTSFTTPCSPSSVPTIIDFTGAFPPSCWVEGDGGNPATGPTTLGTGAWTTDGFGNVGTSGAMKINLFNVGDQDWVITSEFDLTTGGPYQLEFDFGVFVFGNTSSGTLGSDDEVQVLVSTDNGVTWTNLATYNNSYITNAGGNHEIIDLAAYSGNTIRLAFWASEGTVDDPEDMDVMVDNFEIRLTPSCQEPSSLGVTNTSDVFTDVYWTPGGASNWNVEYGPTGFSIGNGTYVSAADDTTAITGLTAATTYDYYVRDSCGPGDVSIWIGPFTFTTLPCSAANQCVFTVDMFDSFGDGWNGNEFGIIQSGVLVAQFGQGFTTGSSFGPANASLCDSIMAYVVVTADGTFNDECSFDITDPFGVLAASFASGNNFNLGDTLASFMALCSPPACADPTNLGNYDVMVGSANIYWSDFGTGTSWTVEYGPAGFTPGNGTTVVAFNDTVNLSGLNAATTYDVYVQANCASSSSAQVGPTTFTTTCVTVPAPYTYDFEIATVGHWDGLDNCWEVISNNPGTTASGGYSWEFRNTAQTTSGTGTGPDRDHSLAPAVGGVFATADVSGSTSGTDSTMLISPMVDISSLTNPQLRFWYHKWGTNMPDLQVDIYDGLTWTNDYLVIPGVTNTSPSDPYIEAKIILSGFASDSVQVRFRIVSDGCCQGDIGLDDFSIAEAPACAAPSALGVTNLSDVSTDVYWTSGGASNWNIEYGPTGFSVGSGTYVSAANDTTALTGLTAVTTYDFYVRDSCGMDDVSTWTGPFTFTTLPCSPADQCVYTVDMFDSFGDGWNGNVFGIMQSGVIVAQFGQGFTTGTNFGPANASLCDSIMAYVVVTVDGTFNDECSFDVNNPFGAQAATFAGGLQFSQGDTLISFMASCTPPACADPANLGAFNISDVSVDVYWKDLVGNAANWNVEYGPTGFTQGTGTSVASANDTTALTGLTAATTYDFYVQADCGGAISNWVGPFTFTTAACALSAQCVYTVDMFDSFGDGWNGNVFGIVQNGVIVEQFGIGFTNGTTFGPASPMLCDSLPTYVVVTVDGSFNDECSFTITTLYGSPAANFAGGVQFSAGDTLATFTTQCTPPPCPDPFNVNITGVTSTSVNFAFSVGSGTAFNFEVGPAGFMQGTGTVSSGSNPGSISGLMPNTVYDLYIQNNCTGTGDGTSNWVGPITFTTACVPFVAPYSESFDGGTWIASTSFNGAGDTIDNCWDRNPAPNAYSWTVRGPGTVSFTTGPDGDNSGTGKYMMLEGSNGAAGNVAELYTPIIDVSALVRPELSFYYHMNVNTGDSIFVDIQDSSGTWHNKVLVLGKVQTAQSDPYEKASIDLNAYGDTVSARFRSVKSAFFNGDMAIDDVAFDNAPLCPEPQLLALVGANSSSAVISFNSTGTSFNYEVGPTGFMQGTGATGTGGKPLTVNGLSPNTTYDVYVQNDCSGSANGTSGWVGPLTFTTSCVPFAAPYSYDFEIGTVGHWDGVDNCWEFISNNPGTSSSGGYSWELRNTPQTTSGTGTGPDRDHTLAPATGGVFVTADVSGSSAGTDSTMLISPFIDVTSLTTPELRFYYHKWGTNMPDLHVDVFDGSWTNDYMVIPGVTQTSPSDPYLLAKTELLGFGDTIQVRFRAVSDGCCQGDIGLDDFSITEAPICPEPNSISSGIITNTSAEINVSSSGSSFNYEWGPAGFTQGTGSTANGGKPYTITGLTPATCYDVYVQNDCSGTGNGISTWVGPYSFCTAVCDTSESCLYTVDLFDSFGDGWNGAIITFRQNGVDVGTLGQGFTGGTQLLGQTISLCDSMPTQVVLTNPGGFSSEIGFDITTPYGVVEASFQASANIPANTVLASFTVLCDAPSCFAPTALGANPLSTSDAQIFWTPGSATNWNIQYGPKGFAVGSGTSATSANDTTVITGLAAATQYDFYVRDSCGPGDVSIWAGPFTFYTEVCDTTDKCNYMVDLFDTFGDGWNGAEITFYQNGIPVTTIGSGFTTGTSFGPVSVALCDSMPTVVRITQLGGFPAEIGFDVYDPFGTILVGSHTARGGLSVDDSLTSFTTNCTPPSCPPPTNATLVSTSSTSATVSWIGGGVGTNYNVEYGPAGYTPGSGTILSTTASPFMISGLTPATCYDVYVRDSCGLGDVSVWIGPISLCTECVSYMAPYSYDFEGASVGHWDGVDSCWTIISNNPGTSSSGGYSWEFRNTPQTTSGTSTGPDRDNTLAPATGGVFVTADVSGSTAGDSTMLISPMINLSNISNPELKYYFHMFGTQMADLHVDVNAGSGWDRDLNLLTGQFNTSQSDPYNDTIVDLSAYSGMTIQVRFRGVSNGCCAGDIALDDISITGAAVACPAPSALAAGSITCNQAALSWTAGSGTTQSSIVEYGTTGFSIGSGTVVTTSNVTTTVTGLQPGTSYDFYVRDICASGDTSAPAGPFTFVTVSGPLNAGFSYVLGSATMTNLAVTFTDNSVGATSWSWNFGDGNTAATQNPVHNYTNNGGYQVTLTITGPCGTDTFQDSVTIAGINLDENLAGKDVMVYPNPTSGKVYIENHGIGTQSMLVEVYALNGKLLKRENFNGNDRAEVDLSKFARGIYNLRVTTDEGVIIRRISRQ